MATATAVHPGKLSKTMSFRRRYGNYIGGRWVEPASGQYFENITPITGNPFCEIPRSNAKDIELALDAAHAAREAWGHTSPTQRAILMNQIAQRMEDNLDLLALAERLLSAVARRTQWPVPAGIEIRIYPSVDAFRDSTGEPGWVAAHTAGVRIDLQPPADPQHRKVALPRLGPVGLANGPRLELADRPESEGLQVPQGRGRLGDRGPPERRIALADLAKRPVDRFPDEIAPVARFAPDEREELKEDFVGQLLPVGCNPGHEHETRPLHEFGAPSAPRLRLFDRERGAIEKHAATGVRDGPVVAVAHPPLHLASLHRIRVVGQRRDDPRLVHSGFPKLQRQRVIAPMLARDLAQHRRADAQELAAGRDAKTALPLGVAGAGERAQVREDFVRRFHSKNRR